MRWFVVLLAAVIVLSSCSGSASRGVRIDPKLSSYIPSGTTILAGIDLDGLKSAPFYKSHQNALNLPALNDATEKIGLDPRHDLSMVLMAWQSGAPLIAAEGSFKAAEVQARLQSSGGKKVGYRNNAIVEAGGSSILFPARNVLVTGPPAEIRASIDNRSGGISEPLRLRLQSLPAADQLWIVSSKGLPLQVAPMQPDVKSMLSNFAAYVTGFDAELAVDTGAHLHVDLDCDSGADAKQIHDALRGAVGLARLTTRDDQLSLLKLYDAVHISYDQHTVHARADLSPELAEQLVNLTKTAR